jgi:IclR family transcriptional regulator, acetate operon repressor
MASTLQDIELINTPRDAARPATTIKSVERALDLMEALSRSGGSLTLSELSADTGLNNSTCHHLVSTLMTRGYIGQNPRTREYALGNKVFDLSDARARQFDFVDVAMPVLRELNQKTGEAVHLAIIQARELVTVAKLDSLHAVKVDSGFAGKTNAAHATASGKAILAWLPESEQRAIVDARGMEAFTADTVTDLDTLRAELALVRRHGYAQDNEEFQPGVVCIGAAIRNHTGGVIASISCSTPTMRASEERSAELIERIKQAAATLSQELGSRTPL